MIEIVMPQGGQDIAKGQVVQWLKSVGDPVQKGELVCEVETEKATFEIGSPANGFLRKIVVPAGQETAILSVIGLVGELGESLEGESAPAPIVPTPGPTVSQEKAHPVSEEERTILRISPKAKRIAEENQVPINELQGTGPGGRIVEKDVSEYISRRDRSPAAATGAKRSGGKLLNLERRRRATAQKMAFSKQTVPHFYVTRAVDMTAALAFRKQIPEVSINDLIVRACALALRDFPQLNASYEDEAHEMLWEDINIAVAVSVGDGLIAPVLENADRLQLPELAKRTRESIEAARNGKLLSLAPGRFTVSNMGMYDVDAFTAIINAPEAAVLAIGTIRRKLVVEDNLDLRIRDMMNVTLSLDHRVCDGAMACRFVNKVRSLLESPEQLS